MTQRQTRTGFLIFPGFPMACLTSLIEPLRAANEISGQEVFSWSLISEQPGKVRSSADVDFDPSLLLKDLKPLNYLILLSAPSATFSDPQSPAHLRRLLRHGTRLGAVSGGVFPLCRSGAVGGDTVSVHWCYAAAFRTEFPKMAASDQVVEIGPHIVTASGAAAAFDLALSMIEAQLGPRISTEVACWFQHPMMRKAGVKQVVPVAANDQTDASFPPLVARAVELYTQNLADPIPIARLGENLKVSPRHIERSFKKATGRNPTDFFRTMRMRAARQIVMYSNERMADIAAAVGYANVKVFSGHYQSEFGISPKEDRQRINLYRVQGNLPVPSL